MNLFMNNMHNMNYNPMIINFPFFERKEVKRDDNIDVKTDVDEILKAKKLEYKNKDVQSIINYIPFTIIKDSPKKGDEFRCLICLYDFEIDEKVSLCLVFIAFIRNV